MHDFCKAIKYPQAVQIKASWPENLVYQPAALIALLPVYTIVLQTAV